MWGVKPVVNNKLVRACTAQACGLLLYGCGWNYGAKVAKVEIRGGVQLGHGSVVIL